MTDWTAFAGFAGVVVLALLLLARASQSMLSPESSALPGPDAVSAADDEIAGDDVSDADTSDDAGASEADAPVDADASDADAPDAVGGEGADVTVAPGGSAEQHPDATSVERSPGDLGPMSTGELLVNVLVSHGLFAGLVVGGAVLWQVPASALGVAWPTPTVVAGGVAVGVALYVLDEVGAAGASWLGVDHDESLRALLTPASPRGWTLLLGGVLPVIAVSEELLFRGVLVGALSAGFGVSPWLLAAGSSVAFALGHGAQGRGGVVVTGLLGFALAAAYVVSGSLLLVVVAHYLVNALEFVVHEGLGVEWA